MLQPRSKSAAARDFKTSKNLGELVRAGLTSSVVGSLFDPGAPRRSSLGLDGADEKLLAAIRAAIARFCSLARRGPGCRSSWSPSCCCFSGPQDGLWRGDNNFPGSLAHEANGSTHNKRQYQPLGSNRQYTCKISSGSMVLCCEFKLSTHHQFYRSASLQTPAIVANERSSASIAPSSSISAL